VVAIEPAPLRDGLYDRVGGWLVLPAIATYLAPFFMAYASFDNFRYFSSSLPATAQQIIVGLGLAFAALAICWFYACVLLSRLDPYFPNTFVCLSLVLIAVNFAGLSILAAYTGNTPTVDDNRDLIRSVVQSVIWVPYMLVSKRVKATFLGIPIPAAVRTATAAPLAPLAKTLPIGEDTARLRRKGHRLGILLTLVSAVFLTIGVLNDSGYPRPAWASFFAAIGSGGVLLGYAFARLWYWFKAA
jgi:hypothetical protein